jgi:ABC-type multidrug transport system ATPase subunit
MQPIVSIKSLSKIYDSGHQALSQVDLDIREGEILALLGPNGAGNRLASPGTILSATTALLAT